MTHIANVPYIIEHGITHSSSSNANPEYIPIGNPSIISRRGNEPKCTVDGKDFKTGDYIPFYFYARMPMLYNIQHGYGVSKVDADDIVYLIVPIEYITSNPSIEYIFSDAHATCKIAKFYGPEHIANIDNLLDIDCIQSKNWAEDYVIREKKQAEFLVKGDLPVESIVKICCHSEEVRQKLLNMGAKMEIIVNSAEAYY